MSFVDPNGMDYRVCLRPMHGMPAILHQYIQFEDGQTISWGPQSGVSGPGQNNSSDSGGRCGKNNETSTEQDQRMKDWAKQNQHNNYNPLTNNCFDFIRGAINAGK